MKSPFFNIDAVLAEFRVASDRASAVEGGAFLDEILTELLRSFLVADKKNDEKVFQGNGCFATFSAKIDVCFRLGLVAREEQRLLHTVRDIRNRFAHQLGEMSFSRQDIRALCANIELPIDMIAPSSIPMPRQRESAPLPSIEKADASNPRSIFEETVVTLMHILVTRTAQASIGRREAPAGFSSSTDVARSMLHIFEEVLSQYDKAKSSPLASLMPEMEPSREACEALVNLQRFFVQQMEAVNRERERKS